MHRAHICHGLSQAYSRYVIPRNYVVSFPPHLSRKFIRSRTLPHPFPVTRSSLVGTEGSKDGNNKSQLSTQQPSEAAENEGIVSSPPTPDERFDPNTRKWIDTWPSSGSKKYSPTLAHKILPLIEATRDEYGSPKSEQLDRLEEVLTEPSQPRVRKHRNLPSRRDILSPSFRKALLSEGIAKAESSPAWSQPRKVKTRHLRSTELLEQELQLIAHDVPHPAPIRNILTILMEDRLVEPSPRHYEALILGNCHPEMGSIESVKSILQEILREGIPIIPAVVFAVVKVLSVHPDSLLRGYIMQLMESQWITIPPDVAQLLIVAMIREDQLELAQAEIDKLHDAGVLLPDWVWTIFIHALCDRRDFEAVLQLFYTLSDQGRTITRPTLLHVLQRASPIMERDTTKYIWRYYVESMHIIPDEAICMDVMAMAAQYNDLTLAESVAIVLQNVTASTVSAPLKQGPGSDPRYGPVASKFEHGDIVTDRSCGDELHTVGKLQGASQSGSYAQRSSGSDASDINVAYSDHDRKAYAQSDIPRYNKASQASSGTRQRGSAIADQNIPRRRSIPEKAQALLDSVRAVHRQSSKDSKHYRLGNLFPLFREDMGLREARFDPRLALQRRQDWWLQPVPSKRKKAISTSRRSKSRGSKAGAG